MNLLREILKLPKNKEIDYYGEQMFIFASEKGFPAEMFKDEVLKKTSKKVLAAIVDIYLIKMTKHKLKAGLEFNGIQHKKLQEYNNKILTQVLLTGDFDTI